MELCIRLVLELPAKEPYCGTTAAAEKQFVGGLQAASGEPTAKQRLPPYLPPVSLPRPETSRASLPALSPSPPCRFLFPPWG